MNIWTFPNLITFSRLAALPFIVLLLWPGVETQHTSMWAALLYAVAGATDFVDGYVARRLNQVSVFGKFIDPLADKLFYLVAMIALLQLPGPRVPALVVMLVLARELSITGLRAIAAAEGVVIAAGRGGKLKTVFGTVGMIFLILHYPFSNVLFGQNSVFPTIDCHRIGLGFTYISLGLSLLSAFSYLRLFSRALNDRP